MKKLLSILLVTIMMICIFVIPASADEIEPRYVVTTCPECNGTATIGEKVLVSVQPNIWVTSCSYANYPHLHDLYIYTANVNCSNCGRYTLTISESVCP